MIHKKPLRFVPILKSMLWGGDAIIPLKKLSNNQTQVGESWEISTIPGAESVVADGVYQGVTLSHLLTQYQAELLGEENYARFGNQFPLLIKFIDAKLDLSLQVHPDDAMAQREHQKPFGKSEMWYILPSVQGTTIRVGLREKITPQEYMQKVENGTISDSLSAYEVKEGDCFYLPAGRVHCIGAGCLMVEIQQASELTYRIFDFDRKDNEGNLRELHTELAAKAINYSVLDDYRTHYQPIVNEGVQLVNTPAFCVAFYTLTERMELDYSELDSFVALVITKGECTLLDEEGDTTEWRVGDTLLLPAAVNRLTIIPHQKSGVEFLESYV